MRFFSICLLVVFSIINFTYAAEEPLVNNANNKQQLVVSDEIKKALKVYNHRFRMYNMNDYILSVREMYKNAKPSEANELPMAITGDFNADGKRDIVIAGRDGIHNLFILFVSENNKYKPVTVYKEKYQPPKHNKAETDIRNPEYGLNQYLSLLAKKYVQLSSDSKFKPRDFIQVETYLGTTKAFYYKDGKIIEYKGQKL